MKKPKKIGTLILAAVLTLSVLSGCGRAFDASAYLKAILDNSYKHDPTDFLDQKIGTKEEAEKLFQQGIQLNMDNFEQSMTISEDLKADFEDLFEKAYAKAEYTVGKAEKQKDDSYLVTVSYKPMNLFSETMQVFQEKVTDLTEHYTQAALDGETIPDESALEAEVTALYKDSMLECLEALTYGEETSTDIRIELNDKVYLPNKEDLTNLENAIFSVDSLT